jgi:hypothetical protein
MHEKKKDVSDKAVVRLFDGVEPHLEVAAFACLNCRLGRILDTFVSLFLKESRKKILE